MLERIDLLDYTMDVHQLYVSWLWNGGVRCTDPAQKELEKAINWKINHRIGQAFEAVQKMDGDRG